MEERLSALVGSLPPVEQGEAVERLGDVGTRPAGGLLLPDGEHAQVEGLRLVDLSLLPVERGEVVKRGADEAMPRAKDFLPDLERAQVEGLGLAVQLKPRVAG